MTSTLDATELSLPSAVLFDMDGTLVDTEPRWWQAVSDTADAHGWVLPADAASRVLGAAVEPTADYLAAVVVGAPPRPALAAELEARFLALVGASPPIVEGARELLSALRARGVKVALVTASPRSLADAVIAALGPEFFDVSIAAGETARTKPHPDPYQAAASALGFAPGACLAVEDSPIGVTSALAAGVPVVQIGNDSVAGTTGVASLAALDLATVSRAAFPAPDDVDALVAMLLGELDALAGTPYGGEAIDQRAHALQAATLAQDAGGGDALVAAALLHDLGYSRLLRGLRPGMSHEESAAEFLAPLLGGRAASLVRSHVLAKRVLVSIRADYLALLSPASVSSLRAQGGPASPELVAMTVAEEWWPDAMQLREFDDLAKVPDLVTPDGAHFAPLLRRLAVAQRG